jgi:hypothetical protein
MHADIAGWASSNFYGGRLSTAGGAAARLLYDLPANPNPNPNPNLNPYPYPYPYPYPRTLTPNANPNPNPNQVRSSRRAPLRCDRDAAAAAAEPTGRHRRLP